MAQVTLTCAIQQGDNYNDLHEPDSHTLTDKTSIVKFIQFQ